VCLSVHLCLRASAKYSSRCTLSLPHLSCSSCPFCAMLPSLWCVCAVSECVGGCIQGGSSTCCVSRLAWWRMGDWLTHQIRHLLSGLSLAGDYLCIMQYHNDTRRQTRRDGKRLTALTTRRAALLVGCRSEVPTAAPRRQARKIDLHLHDTQDAVF